MIFIAYITFILGLSGYIYIIMTPYYKYKIHHYEGQHLVMVLTKCGLYSFVETIILFVLVGSKGKFIFDLVYIIIEKAEFTDKAEKITINCISYSLIWGILMLLLPLFNSFMKRLIIICFITDIKKFRIFIKNWKSYNIMEKFKVVKKDPIELLLFNSAIHSQDNILLFTLKNNKIYIGKVKTLTEKHENIKSENSIEISLIASGYRNKDDLKVKVDYSYYDPNKEEQKESLIYIKQSDLLSISNFDADIYATFTKIKENHIGFI